MLNMEIMEKRKKKKLRKMLKKLRKLNRNSKLVKKKRKNLQLLILLTVNLAEEELQWIQIKEEDVKHKKWHLMKITSQNSEDDHKTFFRELWLWLVLWKFSCFLIMNLSLKANYALSEKVKTDWIKFGRGYTFKKTQQEV